MTHLSIQGGARYVRFPQSVRGYPGSSREVPGAWALEHPKAWRKVRLGLTLVYARLCATIVLTIALFTIDVLLGSDNIGSGVRFWISLGITLSWLVGVVGQILCLFVPSNSGAKPYIISALATEGIAVLFNFVAARVMLATQLSMGTLYAVSGTTMLLGVLAVVLFLLFMRRVAQHIGRYELVDLATKTLVVGSVSAPLAAVGLLGGSFAAILTMEGLTMLLLIVGIAAGIGCLIALVLYAKALTQLRKAITV